MADKEGVTLSPEAIELSSKLTKLQRQTVINIVGGQSQRQAYYSAGGKAQNENSADAAVSRMLADVKVDSFYQELIKSASTDAVMSMSDVLQKLSQTCTADPNELVSVNRDCCRYCHGIEHEYQFTPAEYKKAEQQDSDRIGGNGFDPRREPHPECPECFGRGVEHIHIKDTRDLSPEALQLYAGAKVTRNGIEVLTHSRDKSLELMGRHHALFTDNVDHKNNGGSFEPMSLNDFYSEQPDSKPGSS